MRKAGEKNPKATHARVPTGVAPSVSFAAGSDADRVKSVSNSRTQVPHLLLLRTLPLVEGIRIESVVVKGALG